MLSWNEQINVITNKVNKVASLNVIKRLREFVDPPDFTNCL